MHICILSFIYFNKRYIVHLYYFSDSLFISAHNTLDDGAATVWIEIEQQHNDTQYDVICCRL